MLKPEPELMARLRWPRLYDQVNGLSSAAYWGSVGLLAQEVHTTTEAQVAQLTAKSGGWLWASYPYSWSWEGCRVLSLWFGWLRNTKLWSFTGTAKYTKLLLVLTFVGKKHWVQEYRQIQPHKAMYSNWSAQTWIPLCKFAWPETANLTNRVNANGN